MVNMQKKIKYIWEMMKILSVCLMTAKQSFLLSHIRCFRNRRTQEERIEKSFGEKFVVYFSGKIFVNLMWSFF